MAGLVPAIHVLVVPPICKDVDARDKPGHDDRRMPAACPGCRAARLRCAADPGPCLHDASVGPGSATQREERCVASGTRDTTPSPPSANTGPLNAASPVFP